jgi:hypothetical protein
MDNLTMQTVLANILVGIATLYLIYRAYLKVKNRENSSCGGCSKCSAPQATALITLELPKSKREGKFLAQEKESKGGGEAT